MEVTFVRHGNTKWNAQRRFQGQTDVPLDAKGRAQAQALAALLRDEPFDLTASSDLSRAYETARTICGDRPIRKDARWREFAFGEWEGYTWEQIVKRNPELAEQPHSVKLYAPPGGESFDDVAARVLSALDELRSGNYAKVLVVTHAGPLHALLHSVFHDWQPVRFSPGRITRIAFEEDRARLVTLNEIAHLPV